MAEEEDYFYDEIVESDGDGDGGVDSDSEQQDGNDFAEEPEGISLQHGGQKYLVLTEDEILQCQEQEVTKVCDMLSISRDSGWILLSFYNWEAGEAMDAWFADEEHVREAAGLPPSSSESTIAHDGAKSPRSEKLICSICFEDYPPSQLTSAPCCGHYFCSDCWKGYVRTSMEDGDRCLMLRCPDPSCSRAVGQDLIHKFLSDKEKNRYARFLVRSYVQSSRAMKWCPSPGCEFALVIDGGNGDEAFDVSCRCSNRFCWHCSEEVHRPVDCETAAKWIEKNSSESENTIWLLAYTKPCPKCKRPIEKNAGCMHMTCSTPCSHAFCWLCLEPREKHSYRACNAYYIKSNNRDNEELRRLRASSERYKHFYDRWDANHKSMEKALADLHAMRAEKLDPLMHTHGETAAAVEFIHEAWLQISECRKVLKWTSAYGYYLPEDDPNKNRFFECLQGEAECTLEKLLHCAERELKEFLEAATCMPKEFKDFRKKLIDLTTVTKDQFEKLTRAMEEGLKDASSTIEGGQSSSSASQDTELDPWLVSR